MAWLSWALAGLALVLTSLGATLVISPAAVLRLVLKLYPPDDDTRKEQEAEIYSPPSRGEKIKFVGGQLYDLLRDGSRARAARLKEGNPAARFLAVVKTHARWVRRLATAGAAMAMLVTLALTYLTQSNSQDPPVAQRPSEVPGFDPNFEDPANMPGQVIAGSLTNDERSMLQLMDPKDRARYLLAKRISSKADGN